MCKMSSYPTPPHDDLLMGHKQRDLLAEIHHLFFPGIVSSAGERVENLHSSFFLRAWYAIRGTRSNLTVLVGSESLAFEEGWFARD